MSARSILSVVGQAVGFAYGGPWGAAIGGMLGGAVGGGIDGPVRNEQAIIDDLGAVKFDYGSSIPRLYGTDRHKVVPNGWSSRKRIISHEESVDTKGGGGPSAVNVTRTYEQDWLCYAPLNAKGFARIWINGELEYSARSDSPEATILASAKTSAFRAVTFFDGNATQEPWPVYEAAVDIENAVAYRDRPTIAFEALDLGPSGQPPLIEVEFFTAATPAEGPSYETLLLAHFNGDLTDASGNGRDFSGHTYSFEGGKFDQGVRLTATSAGPALGAAVTIAGADEPYCVEFWLTRLGGNWTGYTICGDGPNNLRFSVADNCLQGMVNSSGATTITGATPLSDWGSSADHCALTRDASNVTRLFLNGQLQGSFTDGAAVVTASGSNAFALGGGPNTQNSVIDEMRWVRGAAVYEANFTPPEAPLEVFEVAPIPIWTPLPVDLADVVRSEALLEWSGETGALTENDIDVTALEGIEVAGFSTTGSPRESIGQLMDVFYFGARCSNGRLEFVPRGAAAVATIPFADTGIGVGQPGTPFTGVERGNDLETPVQVAVTGPNLMTDYEPGTELSDRLVGESKELRQYRTAVVFTPAQRKGRAETMVQDARVSAHTAQINLDDQHAELEVLDVVNHYDDHGALYRLRYERAVVGDGVTALDAVRDDATVLTSSGITSDTDGRVLDVAPLVDTLAVPLDIPILRDEDSARGLYVAAKPAESGRWVGWGYLQSSDDVAYSQLVSGTKATVIGTASTVPSSGRAAFMFNEFDRIVVDVGEGASLASSTREAIVADETVNAFALGAHGRWVLGQFRAAAAQGGGVWVLSGLLLGHRGTEGNIALLENGDRFVLLKATGGVLRVPQAIGDEGVTRYWKAVTSRQASDDVGAQTLVQREVGLRCLSPTHLRISRDASGNATITCRRRTRLATRMTPSVVFPLGEEAAAYELDVFADGSFGSAVRTLVGTPSDEGAEFEYSAAEQTTDFGSAQSTLHVRAHQLSATVGRGFHVQRSA